MNRSLSLSFTDRALPSAIRPSEASRSCLARGARGSRPRPADSQDAVFPSAPLCRPVSHPGTAKPIAGSPSPHRRGPPRFPTAAVLRLDGKRPGANRLAAIEPAARCGSAPILPHLPLDKTRTPTVLLRPPPRDGSAPPSPTRVCRRSPRQRSPTPPQARRARSPRLRYHVGNRQEGTRHARNPEAEAHRASIRRLDKEVHSHVRAARRQRLHIRSGLAQGPRGVPRRAGAP